MFVELIVILAVTAVAARSVGSKVIDGMHAVRGTESERMKKWRERHGPDFKPSGFSRYMDEAWASAARKRADKDADRARKRAQFGYTPGPRAWAGQLWAQGWDRAIHKHSRPHHTDTARPPTTTPANEKSTATGRAKGSNTASSTDPWWARVHMPIWRKTSPTKTHTNSNHGPDTGGEPVVETKRDENTGKWSPWNPPDDVSGGGEKHREEPEAFVEDDHTSRNSYREALAFATQRAADAEEAREFANRVARHATRANETLRNQLQEAKAREELFGHWWREHRAKQQQEKPSTAADTEADTDDSSTVIDGDIVTDTHNANSSPGPRPQLDTALDPDHGPLNQTNQSDINQQEDIMTNANAQNIPAQPSGGEIGTVGKATAFVGDLQVQFDKAASAIEHAQADLASSGVTGTLLDALGTVREHCTSANAALATAGNELAAHASVGEHYRATQGAGEKAYVTGE